MHRAVEGLPRARAGLAHDPVGARADPRRCSVRLLARTGGSGAQNTTSSSSRQRRHLEVGVRELALDQADVELEVGDLARDLLGVRDLQA